MCCQRERREGEKNGREWVERVLQNSLEVTSDNGKALPLLGVIW